MRKILFLVPYPLNEAPSQRFRFEQYFQHLSNAGFQFRVQCFLSSEEWSIFYSKGKHLKKVMLVVRGFTVRILVLFRAPFYEFIFIHREVTPIGPPIVEWFLTQVMRKKVIYDFDDAIWMNDGVHESWLLKFVKWRGKVESICRWSYKVSCGNEYLCSFARTHSKAVYLIPTTIDTDHLHNPHLFSSKTSSSSNITIGWTGSHSTLKYLSEIEPVLQRLEIKYPAIQVMIIADQRPHLKLNTLKFVQWNKTTEIPDLLDIDIGIMPLPDDRWTKGKCGFKALQYMALEIPAVISSVGINESLVDKDLNGFLCRGLDEWEQSLEFLINNANIRQKMGQAGRKKIIKYYSVTSNASSFLSLFR